MPGALPVIEQLRGYVVGPLLTMWDGFVEHVPGLFFIAVLVVVTHYLLRVLRAFFHLLETGAATIPGFYAEWARPTFMVVRVLAIAFAVVVAYPHIPGSDSLAFKGVSVFIGFLVSLGGRPPCPACSRG